MGQKQQFRKNESMESSGSFLRFVSVVFFVGITALYPLYMPLGRYWTMTENKKDLFVKFTIITALVILATLFYLLKQKKRFYVKNYFITDEPVRRLSVAEWAIAGFILWAFISALLSPYSDVWGGFRHEGFFPLLCYVLTFFIIARFYMPKELHFVIFAGSAIILALIGILQFFGHDFLNLFPYTASVFTTAGGSAVYGPVTAGYPVVEVFTDYGPLSEYFRTTLGNLNIVAAYCSFTTVLFTALFMITKSNRKFVYPVYLAASMTSFMLILIAGDGADGGRLAIMVAMLLLIPYWVSDRHRFGRICITLSGWCLMYLWYNSYLSSMRNKIDTSPNLAANDRIFLENFTPRSSALFGIVGVTALVLLVLGLGVIFLLKKWAEKPMKIVGISLLVFIFAGGLLFVEIAGRHFSEQPDNLIWQAREVMHGNLDDDFGSSRGFVWKRGLSVIPENPVFGTGPDTFYYALSPETQEEAKAAYGVSFDKAHNTFLQIAVCLGIPALLAYLVFLGGLFIPAIKRAFNRPILLAFGAGALSYIIQSFFCVEVPIVSPLFWVALGVMAGEIWRERIGCDVFDF
ncbi:MAG: O-antigen ligase family protein [Oscillospiraceae bacterium]|nr:O-antigen ligase family protein [Oscillospiraceae bacterium]